jgi:predicted RNA-binding protein with PIN domain
VFEDGVAAAEHLVRVPGAVLVIDGYNVTKTAWPDAPLAEQRQRLVDALCELTARTGAEADVVFDGADDAVAAAPTRLPRGVHVRFSPASVEADDVVIALVDEYPLGRPVVVVSSDRRVREGAGRRGANVLTSDQFLGALRR